MLGHAVPLVLAKVCAIDCRPAKFPTLGIAQTIIAGLTAVIVRHDIGGIPAFHVLVDTASAAYLWAALLDAAGEYGGRPTGLEAVQALAGE
jgi:sarcosine oxidase subunit gamma